MRMDADTVPPLRCRFKVSVGLSFPTEHTYPLTVDRTSLNREYRTVRVISSMDRSCGPVTMRCIHMEIRVVRDTISRSELAEIAKQQFGNEWIEFDSMINVRPSGWNRSRYVESSDVREAITRIVSRLITG